MSVPERSEQTGTVTDYREEEIMAKIIDDETIENVCILAKLSLSEEAKEKAKEDMQKMLDYVEKLDELDTDGVEPLSHIFGDQNVFREDVVTNGDNKEAMLANAPKCKRRTVSGTEDHRIMKGNSYRGERLWNWNR